MKKLLAFVLCLALMMTSLVFVSADADATLTVATVEGPFFAGEEVTIPVTITEWANAYATIELTFDYDETLLELDAIEASEDDFSGSMSASNTETNQFSLICNPSSDKSAKKLLGGEICVAYFVAAADITESIAINVTAAVKGYAQGKDDNWTQTKTLTVEINNGGINVETIGGECPHEGGTATCNAKAICDLCGEQYGELDVTNHAEGTEVRGSSDTYTGDIHCLGCGKMLEQGRPIESNDAVGTVIVSNTNGKQGDEVTVTVSLGENTALAAYDATLEFDKTALELVQMEKGDFCIAVNVANGKANGFNVENVIDKTLFSATFKILAQEGELEVGVSFTKAILSDLTPVTMNITKGIVTVEEEPNEDTVTMTVGTVDGPIYKGQEIEIPITISEWANGYATIEFAIDFDETLLEVDAIEISDKDFKGAMGAGNGNKFALLCNTNTLEQQQKTDGGEVCVIYFIAAADINEDVVVEIESIEVNGYVKGKTDNWTQYGLLSVETIDGGIKSDSDQGEDNDHDCAPVGDIQYDETNHWYNCVTVGCGVLVNVAPHEGGTATCNAKAECIVCGAEYGNVNANNHAGGTEILNASETYTGDIYCLGCNEVIRKGTTIISSYGVGYVTVSNATGKQGDEVTVTVSLGKYTTIAAYGAELVYDETVLQLVSMAEGYFCDAVNAANGRAIGIASKNVTSGSLFTATFKILKGTGPFTVDVEFDENSTANLAGESVTINVTPGTISVRCEHAWNNGEVTKEATCTEAGEKLFTCTKCKGTKTEAIAVLDHSWEVGVTKEPTCNEAGEKVYNCIGCGLTKSEAIPATGNHIGGTATCNAKAKCSICSKEYGKINANNHAGGTEIRNTSATYTGDIYC
ncbi:MAG: hypothetical protein IKT35_02595, partial [Clostridia bacterium]|nr:hypothetical protein [Clostridia bacterium]